MLHPKCSLLICNNVLLPQSCIEIWDGMCVCGGGGGGPSVMWRYNGLGCKERRYVTHLFSHKRAIP